jgi:NitT/TauT family transport system substrate-binding protein
MSAIDSGADALRIYGNLSLLEMAPVLLAAEAFYDGETVIRHGGVMNLWGQGSDLASLSSAGRADLATNSETQTLRGAMKHPELRIIFTVAECPYRIVARRSAGIERLVDLKGKRVGTQIDSSAQYFLDAMLRTAGLTQADVVSVPFMAKTEAPLTLMPQALREGRLDAVALWEPTLQRCTLALGDDAVAFRDPAVYTEKFNLSTSQANLDEPALRKRIVAFVRALMAAVRRLREDPASGQRLVAQAAALDLATVKSAWPYVRYPGTLAPDLLDVFEQQDVWIAKIERREPRSRGALARLIDDSVLREALSG